MSWTQIAALETLRVCLGDGHADHFEFKADVTPTPDGLHRLFFLGRTRVLKETVAVYLSGTRLDDDDVDVDESRGTMEVATAPTGAMQASFHWQWFTDSELTQFLTDATTQLGYTGLTDTAFPVPLRSVALDLASAMAYTRKAAEYAESLQASSPDGYSIETSKSHPNWAGLAKDALSRAQTKFKWYVDSPLAMGAPGLRLVSFTLPSYTPRT
jgi:hypothetical protein